MPFHCVPTSWLEQNKTLKKSTNYTSWTDLANSTSLQSEDMWNPPTARIIHIPFTRYTMKKKKRYSNIHLPGPDYFSYSPENVNQPTRT